MTARKHKKYFSVLIALLPLINNYSIPGVPGALSDIATIFLCLIILYDFLCTKTFHIRNFGIAFIPYFLVICVNFMMYVSSHGSVGDVFIDYARQFLWLFVLIVGIPKCGDEKNAFKALECISLATCFYCWLQLLFVKRLGIILPSYVPGLSHREDLDNEIRYLNYTQYYRPHSLFSEPSIFCEYLLVYITLLLFWSTSKKLEKRTQYKKWFVIATCFITGSTTGILGVVSLFLFSFFLSKKESFRFKSIYLLYVPPVILALFYIFSSSMFQIFWQRTFIDGSALDGRFGKVNLLMGRTGISAWFGDGFVYDSVVALIGWIPGFALTYMYYGILGLAVILITIFSMYIRLGKKNFVGKALLLLFFLMNCSSYPLFSTFLLLDLFFVVKPLGCEKNVRK